MCGYCGGQDIHRNRRWDKRNAYACPAFECTWVWVGICGYCSAVCCFSGRSRGPATLKTKTLETLIVSLLGTVTYCRWCRQALSLSPLYSLSGWSLTTSPVKQNFLQNWGVKHCISWAACPHRNCRTVVVVGIKHCDANHWVSHHHPANILHHPAPGGTYHPPPPSILRCFRSLVQSPLAPCRSSGFQENLQSRNDLT